MAESLRADHPRFRKRLTKLLEKGTLTANDVAEITFQALEKPRFWILPHAREKIFWYLKCYLPQSLYHQVVNLMVRLIRRSKS